jgi:hypothetical protein
VNKAQRLFIECFERKQRIVYASQERGVVRLLHTENPIRSLYGYASRWLPRSVVQARWDARAIRRAAKASEAMMKKGGRL